MAYLNLLMVESARGENMPESKTPDLKKEGAEVLEPTNGYKLESKIE